MGVNVGHYAPLPVPAMLPKRGIPHCVKSDCTPFIRIRVKIVIADK
jgi:hypothetical protein